MSKELDTLKTVYEACKGKLPERYALNDGSPKADCMVDVKPLLKAAKDKGAFVGDLLALSTTGLIVYRHDLRRVALTATGIELVGKDGARQKAEQELKAAKTKQEADTKAAKAKADADAKAEQAVKAEQATPAAVPASQTASEPNAKSV